MNKPNLQPASDAIQSILSEKRQSDQASREKLLKRCTLSVSGLRFICDENNEHSINPKPDQETFEFVLTVINEFSKLVKSKNGHPTLWLGMDARPTGPTFLLTAYQIFQKLGITVKIIGYAPIPEIMAACHQSGADGFCYFTASHNPAGHNGFKLGLSDGAVLSKLNALPLIESVKENYVSGNDLQHLYSLLDTTFSIENLNEEIASNKLASLDYYKNFSIKTIANCSYESFTQSIKDSVKDQNPIVVIDFNGSSRLSSIDQQLLSDCGFQLELIGSEIGKFSHAIVPEGDSLNDAQNKSNELLKEDKNVFLAMVPDCDGDRGNLIVPINGKASKLKAQETFALCCLAETLAIRAEGSTEKIAIAANGPTSLRLEALLSPFDVKIQRAEVGEANVLSLAEQLKQKEYLVPISGEGSNGGNIIDGTTVRDPLMTLLSILKYLFIPNKNGETTSHYYLSSIKNQEDPTLLSSTINTLPVWYTTDAFDSDAILPVPNIEHEVLKQNYEKLFAEQFNPNTSPWVENNITSYKFISHEGTQTIQGPGNRPAPGKGGFKVELYQQETLIGYLWMRGSGTEPVFRVVTDTNLKSGSDLHKTHLNFIEESTKL